MKRIWKLFPWLLIGIISFTIVLLVLKANNLVNISPVILIISRLLCVALLFIHAFRKKSLTTWILVSLVAGAEFGYDVPSVAKDLQVFSDIFLRLIKTIFNSCCGYCRACKYQADWKDGVEVSSLF
jgi:proton glutamate symport protein